MEGNYRFLFKRFCMTAMVVLSLYCSTTPAMPEQGVFFGTPEFDRANSIIADGSRGYYLVGANTTQEGTYGWIRLYQPGLTIDRNVKLPIEQPSSFSSSLLFDVVRLPDGDLIAVGSGLPKNFATLPEAQQREDGWVIRVSPEGRTIWSQRLASEHHERLYFVTARPDGTILVGGRSETVKNTGSSKGVSYIIDPATGEIVHRSLWEEERIRRAGFYDGVALPNGGYVLVGWATRPHTNKDDVWLVGIKPNHVEQWSRTWGGAGDDIGYQIILDDNGDIKVLGWGTQETHKYTGGLAMHLNQTGRVLNSVFLNVGTLGDDKFLSGIQLPNGEYVIGGEASLSSKQYRGKAWLVKLDRNLEKVEEQHFQIRGSRILGLAANRDNVVFAAGYGVAPGHKQVDAWISEAHGFRVSGVQEQVARLESDTQQHAKMEQETLPEGSRVAKKEKTNSAHGLTQEQCIQQMEGIRVAVKQLEEPIECDEILVLCARAKESKSNVIAESLDFLDSFGGACARFREHSRIARMLKTLPEYRARIRTLMAAAPGEYRKGEITNACVDSLEIIAGLVEELNQRYAKAAATLGRSDRVTSTGGTAFLSQVPGWTDLWRDIASQLSSCNAASPDSIRAEVALLVRGGLLEGIVHADYLGRRYAISEFRAVSRRGRAMLASLPTLDSTPSIEKSTPIEPSNDYQTPSRTELPSFVEDLKRISGIERGIVRSVARNRLRNPGAEFEVYGEKHGHLERIERDLIPFWTRYLGAKETQGAEDYATNELRPLTLEFVSMRTGMGWRIDGYAAEGLMTLSDMVRVEMGLSTAAYAAVYGAHRLGTEDWRELALDLMSVRLEAAKAGTEFLEQARKSRGW